MHRYESWFCCWAFSGLTTSAVCSLPHPHPEKPPRPRWCADLLGLLPSDGQQAGDALDELALPDDDQVSYGPRAKQVPVGRGREEEVWGMIGERRAAGAQPAAGGSRDKGREEVQGPRPKWAEKRDSRPTAQLHRGLQCGLGGWVQRMGHGHPHGYHPHRIWVHLAVRGAGL